MPVVAGGVLLLVAAPSLTRCAAPPEEYFRPAASHYRKHAQALSDIAAYHAFRNEWRESLSWLLRAQGADSTNVLVIQNMGWAHRQLGDTAATRRCYRRVAALAYDSDRVAIAQRRLERVK